MPPMLLGLGLQLSKMSCGRDPPKDNYQKLGLALDRALANVTLRSKLTCAYIRSNKLGLKQARSLVIILSTMLPNSQLCLQLKCKATVHLLSSEIFSVTLSFTTPLLILLYLPIMTCTSQKISFTRTHMKFHGILLSKVQSMNDSIFYSVRQDEQASHNHHVQYVIYVHYLLSDLAPFILFWKVYLENVPRPQFVKIWRVGAFPNKIYQRIKTWKTSQFVRLLSNDLFSNV